MGIGIILVPTHTIKDQFKNDANGFGIPVREYREWISAKDTEDTILLSTPVVLYNDIIEGKCSERLSLIRFVIADECHHAGCETWNHIFMNLPNLERVYGFSALPIEQHNEYAISFATMSYEDALTIATVGPIIYQKSTKELKEFLNIPTLINIPYKWPKHISDELYSEYTQVKKLMKSEHDRSRLIADIMRYLCEKGYICITHVHETEQAENIMELCGTSKVVVWKGGGKVYHSLETHTVDQLRELIGKEVFGLICTRHAVEGLNLEGVPINVTILSEEKRPRATVQKTGRAVRPGELPSFVINIRDEGISILPKHGQERSIAIAQEFDSDTYTVKHFQELKELITQLEFNS